MAKLPKEEYALLQAPDSESEADGSGGPVDRAATTALLQNRFKVTVCYCAIMVLNGGLVGAFGPSLEPLSRQTGASLAILGGSVMQNRVSKLAGTVVWGMYAARVQTTSKMASLAVQPNTVISAALLVLAACCAVFGFTRSTAVLQVMMNLSGFMYGISDSAVSPP